MAEPLGVSDEVDAPARAARTGRAPKRSSAEGDPAFGAARRRARTAEADAGAPERSGPLVRFLTHRSAGFPRSNGALDLLLVVASFAAAHASYLDGLEFSADRLVVLFAALVLMSSGLSLGGMYRQDRTLALHEELGRLTICWALALAGIGLFAFLTKTGEDVSRVWVGSSMLASLALLIGVRVGRGLLLASTRASSLEARDIVLVGAGELARMALERVDADRWAERRVAAVFGETGPLPGGRVSAGPIGELAGFVETRRRAGRPVAEVWIALPLSEQGAIVGLLEALRDSSVDVCLVPDAFGLQLLTGAVTNVADLRVVNVSDIRLSPRAELFKRAFDRTVATLALAALALPMAAIALAIRLESPGPVIFRQRRYGIDGREIEVWKFRSMRVQENGDEVRQAVRGDARVTRVGRLIRRTSLDELPQLVNVLQGTMSIVGPRPHAVVHNEAWRRQIPGYMLRHKIKPGITGWAQVNGWRGETDTFEKMERRVHFDLEYIRNWSPWLDVRIMGLALARGLAGRDVY